MESRQCHLAFCASESDAQNSSMYANLLGSLSYAKTINATFAKEELVAWEISVGGFEGVLTWESRAPRMACCGW
jgi:hypothetical protein